MKHWVALGVFLLSAGVGIDAGRQAAQFRSGVDLVQVDVTVLDRNRRPVQGLAAADFTLTENGVPQTISSFAAVELPAVQASSAPWARTAVADVATNTLGDRRLFVLYLDDQHFLEPGAIRDAKGIAQTAIEQLGPGDLGAVVFPVGHQHSYEIRASAPPPRVNRTGSVFGDVEVPDFASSPVSVSGLTLEESPAPLAGPAEALSGLLPIVPRTSRVFSAGETIGTFLRVYQGGNRETVPVS